MLIRGHCSADREPRRRQLSHHFHRFSIDHADGIGRAIGHPDFIAFRDHGDTFSALARLDHAQHFSARQIHFLDRARAQICHPRAILIGMHGHHVSQTRRHRHPLNDLPGVQIHHHQLINPLKGHCNALGINKGQAMRPRAGIQGNGLRHRPSRQINHR